MKLKGLKRTIFILALIVLNIGCDQITKVIVREKLEYNERIEVVGENLILTKVENTGAFLGMGKNIPRSIYMIIMILLPCLVIGYGIQYVIKNKQLSGILVVAITFIIGGGIGNIFDRIMYGSVTDFLFFDFVIFRTGIVNMADISVTTGFFMVLYEQFIYQRKVKTETTETDSPFKG